MDHKFSIGFKSGEFPGHGERTLIPKSSRSPLTLTAQWQGAPSCWKMQLWSKRRSSIMTFSYQAPFIAMFLGRIWRDPVPWAEKQPQTCTMLGCFTVGTTQSWLKHSHFLLLTRALPDVPKSLKGASSENMTLLHCSTVHSCISCKMQACPLCFSCLKEVS